jgi:hypothetical protein
LFSADKLDWRTQQRFQLTEANGVYVQDLLYDCAQSGAESATNWRRLLDGRSGRYGWRPIRAMVSYRPSGEELVEAKAYLEATGLLQELEDVLNEISVPVDSRDVHLVSTQCGEANAFWMPSGSKALDLPQRSLVLCYEDVADLFARGRALGLR